MSLRSRIGILCIRLGITVLLSGFLFLLPAPHTGELVPFKNAGISLLTVILIGVALYDTFFYNRTKW